MFRYDGGTNFQELTPGTPEDNENPAILGDVTAELIRAGGLGGGIGSVLYSDDTQSSDPDSVEFFVYNAVGHTVALSDYSSAVTQSTVYEAFGQDVAQSGTSINNRLRNTKERDASIGLDNDGFRYYDPATGRYIQRDPIGYGDGMNVYHSVKNNPVNAFDPLGLSVWDHRNRIADAMDMAYPDLARAERKEILRDQAKVEKVSSAIAQVPAAAGGAVEGAKVGGKANLNAAADTVVSTVTIGQVDNIELIPVTDDDISAGYAGSYGSARVGYEVLSGVATGGADKLGKAGKVAKVLDVASNARSVVEGGTDMAVNGVSMENGTQVLGGALGLGGNFARKAGDLAPENGKITVTSWADKPITPDLNPGRWVMKGEATNTNFLLSGLWGPKGGKGARGFRSQSSFNSITDQVPADKVVLPPGLDKWRGMFGQRRIKE